MNPGVDAPRRIASAATSLAFLIAILGMCVYRAVTQSVTHDEALTWRLFISGPWHDVFHHFDANHHFLNTVLMRISTTCFGLSEWSMRVPALLGACVYLGAVYRLSRTVFGTGWMSCLVVGVLTMNPLVLDFMVAARGYGLGLGLWMLGLTCLLQVFAEGQARTGRLVLAGGVLALSITANLVFAPPAAGLAGIALWMAHRRTTGAELRPWITFAGAFAVVTVVFVLVAPVDKIRMSHLYAGAPTAVESARSLTVGSLEHSGPWRSVLAPVADGVALFLGPAIVLTGVVAAIVRRDLLLTLVAGSLVFSVCVRWAAHVALGRPYPDERTGLYLLPMGSLVLLGLVRIGLESSPVARVAAGLGGAVALGLVLHFASEVDVRMFWTWTYDADTRRLGEYIAGHRSVATPSRTERVCGSFHLQEALAFYRSVNKWEWMKVVVTRGSPPPLDCEWYAWVPWDDAQIAALDLREVYRGPISGSILAVPRAVRRDTVERKN